MSEVLGAADAPSAVMYTGSRSATHRSVRNAITPQINLLPIVLASRECSSITSAMYSSPLAATISCAREFEPTHPARASRTERRTRRRCTRRRAARARPSWAAHAPGRRGSGSCDACAERSGGRRARRVKVPREVGRAGRSRGRGATLRAKRVSRRAERTRPKFAAEPVARTSTEDRERGNGHQVYTRGSPCQKGAAGLPHAPASAACADSPSIRALRCPSRLLSSLSSFSRALRTVSPFTCRGTHMFAISSCRF